MGGTSTDVCHYDGTYERSFESQVAGARVRAPMMLIHTVAAGGGSILHYDEARFRVGPDSAGADPGPLSYRRQGPLTVTDANVMTGKLQPEFFPHIFGPEQNESLDEARCARRSNRLPRSSATAAAPKRSPTVSSRIAVENMANAIKTISVQRGYDVTEYVLNSFGGAGGQHACLVADALGIKSVLIHPLSGVLSAFGMGLASLSATRTKSVLRRLDENGLAAVAELRVPLEHEVKQELIGQGIASGDIAIAAHAHLRYAGTDSALPIPLASLRGMRALFEIVHQQRFGFISPEKDIEIEAIEVEARGGGEAIAEPDLAAQTTEPASPRAQTRMFTLGAWHDAPIYLRADLVPGHTIEGPALIIEDHQTVVVEPGWQAQVTARNHLLLTRIAKRTAARVGKQADPVMVEVFNNLFVSIAEQMGYALQNTARSVNIKERLDFSCAIFDAKGRLIANAPHIPVHLGSMDRSVATVLREVGEDLKPGDVYMLNAPYNGGTHLPDITVVTPVFGENSPDLLFFVAARGHHADIGGIAPGSMSPKATRIEEEGVYIDPFKLVARGRFREDEVRKLLTEAPYPARNPEQNIADLKAQVAANEKGVTELRNMVRHYGLAVVRAYMGHVQDNAAEAVSRVIAGLKRARFEVETDQGNVIKVAITIDRKARRAVVDFTGTSAQAARHVQRAGADHPRLRALCVPHAGRRRHPAQCRLPASDQDRGAQGLDAEAALSGGRGGGQCRDQPDHRELSLRRARRARLGARHDEQSHLRQRALPILRDDLLGRAGRSGLRRRAGGADAHDQFAADRPRGARAALSGAARAVRDRARLGRQGRMARRRRHASRHPVFGAHGLRDPVGLPQGAAVRPPGRRARSSRRELGEAEQRPARAAQRLRPNRARPRRGHHHQDADRRGFWRSMSRNSRVLISGAGIAGLTLAVLLKDQGYEPLVVERNKALRSEGYMMDFFGSGWDVAERMGLTDELRAIHYPIDALQFVDSEGKIYASVPIERVRHALGGKYVYLRRSDLERILHDRAQAAGIAIRYGSVVTGLRETANAVRATFVDGAEADFALVFGADGVHSGVRRLVFGEERQFERFLGGYVSAFHLNRHKFDIGRALKLHEETGPGHRVLSARRPAHGRDLCVPPRRGAGAPGASGSPSCGRNSRARAGSARRCSRPIRPRSRSISTRSPRS